ncbi:MAG TPA: PadR family transcriptional regulator [Thermoplasmata archaeon]|jgi:DNA-binding PadR family transcriptional regulator|nr:PadR family transcriptional regulator [Thermoplasmata archaeon]
MARPSTPGPMPGRVLWLYALATLDREGSLYGYSLADRIANRTDGTWRPGPGAIYPALRSLVERGAARSSIDGSRRVYSITPAGHALLRRIREQMAGPGPGAPDLGLLWAEIAGSDDPGDHLLRHLRRHLEGLDTFLARRPDAKIGSIPLREAAIADLSAAVQRLDRTRPVRRGGAVPARGRGGR